MLIYEMANNVDRDCARWKLAPAEVQKRRALFWELFITDCWQVGIFVASNSDDFTEICYHVESRDGPTSNLLPSFCRLRATV